MFSKGEAQASSEPQKSLLSAADYCERGQKSMDAGKYVEAMEFFQAAIEADKHFEKAYLLLATTYEKQGNKDKAKAALYGLLSVDPNNAEALRRIQGGPVIEGTTPSTSTSIPPSTSNYFPPSSADYDLCVSSGANRLYFKIRGYEASVVAPNPKRGNDNYWEGYKEPEDQLAIPEAVSFQGSQYPVTSIGECAFWRCRRIVTVNIPEPIAIIEDRAFDNCNSLCYVKLPSTLVEIGLGAFSSCAFESIDLPQSVQKIGNEAFKYTKIRQFVVPDGLQTMSANIVHGCPLESITISASVNQLTGYWTKYNHSENFTMIMKGHPPIVSSMAEGIKVVVPDSMIGEYRDAQYWQCCDLCEQAEREKKENRKTVGKVIGVGAVIALLALLWKHPFWFVIVLVFFLALLFGKKK